MNSRIQQAIDEHLRELERAGASKDDLDFAREFISPQSDKPEDEQILDIEAAWAFVRDTHIRKGAKL